jgi:D-glycero-D-manno-heptose 1,7-bisphosphate phosphatase
VIRCSTWWPPHLVLTGNGEKLRDALQDDGALPDVFPPSTQVHADLAAFAEHLLAEQPDFEHSAIVQ